MHFNNENPSDMTKLTLPAVDIQDIPPKKLHHFLV